MRTDHKRVLVPLGTWEYSSPLLKIEGKQTDLGLLAEALLYYDHVVVDIQTDRELTDLVNWAIVRGHVNDLLALFREGVIQLHHHGFLTSALNSGGTYSLWNIPESPEPRDWFIQKIVYRADLSSLHSRKKAPLIKAMEDSALVASVDSYGPPVHDAERALKDETACSNLLQPLVDELYGARRVKPPEVSCQIGYTDTGLQVIHWNQDLNRLNQLVGGKLDLRVDMPMIAEAHSNRLIWTASNSGFDLFLGDVMSTLTRNKLVEASEQNGRVHDIIQELKFEVEFPDVRRLVNSGDLQLDRVLEIRRKSGRFRSWLQQEGDKDRNALMAYHTEVAESSGFRKAGVRALKVFGHASAVSVPAYAFVTKDGSLGSAFAIAGAAEGAALFLDVVEEKLAHEWRPAVFGNWAKKKLPR